MKIDIFAVPYEKKHVLRNMLELYFHDMSEFDDKEDRLELNDAGLYGYRYLDFYWTEADRYPYIVTVDGNLAGFSLIRVMDADTLTFEVAEFFILKKYRNKGIGNVLISKMFSLHKGKWIIDTSMKNTVAQRFWRNAINKSGAGTIDEYQIEDGRRLQWAFNNSDM